MIKIPTQAIEYANNGSKLLKLLSFILLVDIILTCKNANIFELSFRNIVEVVIIFCCIKILIYISFALTRILANYGFSKIIAIPDIKRRYTLHQEAVEEENEFKLKLYYEETKGYCDTQANSVVIFEIIIFTLIDHYFLTNTLFYSSIDFLPEIIQILLWLIFVGFFIEDLSWLYKNNT